jgi:hypothetical protein
MVATSVSWLEMRICAAPRRTGVRGRLTLTSSNQIGLASQISLRSLQPYLPEMTEEVVRKIESELAALEAH